MTQDPKKPTEANCEELVFTGGRKREGQTEFEAVPFTADGDTLHNCHAVWGRILQQREGKRSHLKGTHACFECDQMMKKEPWKYQVLYLHGIPLPICV